MDLGNLLRQITSVRLPGGVVAKVCTVLIVVSVCISGLAYTSHNEWIIVGGIGTIFLLALVLLWRLISFADRHPQAALLEGGQFLRHEQMAMGSKATPVIRVFPNSEGDDRPLALSPDDVRTLDVPEDSPALPPRDPGTSGGRRG